ncbi:MAG: hypothetical protein V7742_22355 [Halioglobus sp.]
MGTSDLLLMGIECSVAFAGFAGIIATFQFSDRASVKRGDVVGLTMIVQNSLSIAFACTLPLVLKTFALKDETIWAAVSVYGAFSMAFSSYLIDKSMRGAVRKASLKLLFGSMQAIAALVSICLLLNASDIIFHRQPGPYIVALTVNLGLVGYMFARLLLRPLWHEVRSQERAVQSKTVND